MLPDSPRVASLKVASPKLASPKLASFEVNEDETGLSLLPDLDLTNEDNESMKELLLCISLGTKALTHAPDPTLGSFWPQNPTYFDTNFPLLDSSVFVANLSMDWNPIQYFFIGRLDSPPKDEEEKDEEEGKELPAEFPPPSLKL